MDKCYYCGNELGTFADRYVVRKAIKPKGYPYRWKVVGYMCECCESAGCRVAYDEFKQR